MRPRERSRKSDWEGDKGETNSSKYRQKVRDRDAGGRTESLLLVVSPSGYESLGGPRTDTYTQALNFPQLLIRLSWFSPQARLWLAITTAMRHIMTAICGCEGRKWEKKTERHERLTLFVEDRTANIWEWRDEWIEWMRNGEKLCGRTDRPQNCLCGFVWPCFCTCHQNISMRLHTVYHDWCVD